MNLYYMESCYSCKKKTMLHSNGPKEFSREKKISGKQEINWQILFFIFILKVVEQDYDENSSSNINNDDDDNHNDICQREIKIIPLHSIYQKK